MGLLSPFFKKSKPVHPLLKRNNDYFSGLDQNLPLEEYDFVVLDTELTALEKRKGEIVSIGAVRVKNLRIAAGEIFYSHARPKDLKPRESVLIHRITPQELLIAPALGDVLEDFLEFSGQGLLVGHYVDLDIGFINRALSKSFGGGMKTPCIDTMRLAQAYAAMRWEQSHDRNNMKVSFNLNDLAEEYDIPRFPAHNALQDALQTAYLFLYLVKKIHRHGYRTLKELSSAGRNAFSYF